MKRKYIRVIALVIGICVAIAGCSLRPKKEVDAVKSPEPTESIPTPTAPEKTPEPTPEPKPSPSPTPSSTPSPTPEVTEPEPYIVTDVAEIAGMVEHIVGNMTLEEKIGQMFLVNFELLDKSQGSYYEHTKLTEEMKENLEKYNVGGVIFFARNIETIDQTKGFIEALQENSRIPLFVGVEEEGGEVARIGNNSNMHTTVFPSMEEVGAMEDTDYAFHMGATIGREIKELGFNLNFAPVADVKANELNTRLRNRSFGSNPKKAAKMIKQVVSGLISENVIAALKHFPGEGEAEGDPIEKSTDIDIDLNHLRDIEFVPFKAGIKAGSQMVLVSHVSLGRVTGNTKPASMSSLVLNEILRIELSFRGVIITDAMDAKAITERYTPEKAALNAIKAGADIVLMPEDLEKAYNSVLQAVEEGKLSKDTIDASVRRIIELKIKQGIILSDYVSREQ